MAYFHTTVLDNQIKALPTVSTASGSVATFDTDMTENLIEVKCQIVAQQGGSGTPSPDNVRPIQTYTEMNVFATGKNLAYLFVDGKVPSISTGALVNSSGARSDFIRVKPNNDYTLSVSNSQQLYVFFYEENTASTFISYRSSPVSERSLSVTIPYNCNYVMLRTGSNDYTGGQFEKGESPTAYEPFGTTANIPFGQTVANGVLNVTTGKLRVTHNIMDLGSRTWARYTPESTNIPVFCSLISNLKPASQNGLCDIYSVLPYFQPLNERTDKTLCIHPSLPYIYIADTDYTSATDFDNSVDGHTFIYELATPIEIQLSSTQIQALLNENNIWCDTGDTSVKYILSVGKAIS